jgi:hypothetical protein
LCERTSLGNTEHFIHYIQCFNLDEFQHLFSLLQNSSSESSAPTSSISSDVNDSKFDITPLGTPLAFWLSLPSPSGTFRRPGYCKQQKWTLKLFLSVFYIVSCTRFVGVGESIAGQFKQRWILLMWIWWTLFADRSFSFARNEYHFTSSWLRGLILSNYSTTQECSWYLDCMTLGNGTDILHRNVGNKLPPSIAQQPWRAKTSKHSSAWLMLLPSRNPFKALLVPSTCCDCSVFRSFLKQREGKVSKWLNLLIS